MSHKSRTPAKPAGITSNANSAPTPTPRKRGRPPKSTGSLDKSLPEFHPNADCDNSLIATALSTEKSGRPPKPASARENSHISSSTKLVKDEDENNSSISKSDDVLNISASKMQPQTNSLKGRPGRPIKPYKNGNVKAALIASYPECGNRPKSSESCVATNEPNLKSDSSSTPQSLTSKDSQATPDSQPRRRGRPPKSSNLSSSISSNCGDSSLQQKPNFVTESPEKSNAFFHQDKETQEKDRRKKKLYKTLLKTEERVADRSTNLQDKDVPVGKRKRIPNRKYIVAEPNGAPENSGVTPKNKKSPCASHVDSSDCVEEEDDDVADTKGSRSTRKRISKPAVDSSDSDIEPSQKKKKKESSQASSGRKQEVEEKDKDNSTQRGSILDMSIGKRKRVPNRKYAKSVPEPDEVPEHSVVKTKRKRPLKATEHLSQVKDLDVQASDGEEYKQSCEENSDDDDDNNEDEDDDDEVESNLSSDNNKIQSGRKYHANNRLSKWKTLFAPNAKQPSKTCLQQLQEFYSNASQELLFPDLHPHREQWTPLAASQRLRYTPCLKPCVKFTADVKRMSDSEVKTDQEMSEEHRLNWGQASTIDGNSYCCTGAPIRALEWCPLPSNADCDQVVAVATDLMEGTWDSNRCVDGPGLLQFWTIRNAVQDAASYDDDPPKLSTPVSTSLQFCVAHDSGRVRSMSWCPRRVFAQVRPASDCLLLRMGLLAVASTSGKVLVFSIPQLCDLPAPDDDVTAKDKASSVLFVKPEATLTLQLNSKPTFCGPCLCVAWQSGGDCCYVAAGYSTGTIVLWDLQSTSPLLRFSQSSLRPLRCFQHHTAPVLSMAWCPQLPNTIVSSSYDFNVRFTDVGRPGALNFEERSIHPSLYHSICWAGPLYYGFFCAEESLTVSRECGVKYVGLTLRTMGRKRDTQILLHNNKASTWDVHFCPYTELAVSCDANGQVKVFLMAMEKLTKDNTKLTAGVPELMSRAAGLLYEVQVVSTNRSDHPAANSAKEFESPKTLPESTSGSKDDSQNISVVDNPGAVIGSNGIVLASRNRNDCKPVSKHSLTNTSSHQQKWRSNEDNQGEFDSTKIKPSASCSHLSSSLASKASVVEVVEAGSSRHLAACDSQLRDNTSVVPQSLQSNTCKDSLDTSTDKSFQQVRKLSQMLGTKTKGVEKDPLCVNGETNGGALKSASTRSELNTTQKLFNPQRHQSGMAEDKGQISTVTAQSDCQEQSEAAKSSQEDGSFIEDCGSKDAEMLHFKCVGKILFKDWKQNCEENLIAPNKQAICRVRLNPNPQSCAWLASGGHSGLLRLDDLSTVLGGHRPVVKKLRAKTGFS
ncbi:general transcription factor 3c polypeptide 2 [Plakobranchus ocellatus]|uniref:General transcription factor 3c polypeptide 2 n=1 Tax=Plakobranchus ocellatus TaxID=259542 RepID=A0AAV3ZF43_9GAST|nr:general transcription factor 3c polypeptide 2 [Plakobranchus ocellatus]